MKSTAAATILLAMVTGTLAQNPPCWKASNENECLTNEQNYRFQWNCPRNEGSANQVDGTGSCIWIRYNNDDSIYCCQYK
ncbi:hypothetical protein CTRI78_v010362 [Colletotrichum trifolii]|uniref:Uncharacterized protein n=1 Tax=Colletotrichum trifolii TaxID=5466 RepID=A0A4R8QTR2_COLTR|nr:hypothetical protein CTRI78_v010362 [Colletotrichum trifolii]